MKKALLLVVACACVALCADEPTTYVVDVPEGTTLDVTADIVAAAQGKTIVKTGKGAFAVNNLMEGFAGDIYINDGYWIVNHTNALGNAVGKTYVNGGTIVNRLESGSGGKNCVFQTEELHLAGSGCDNCGAVSNTAYSCDFARKIILDGDVRIVTNSRFDFRFSSFNMNSHKMVIRGSRDGAAFAFTVTKFSNMGDVEVEKGILEFQSNCENILASATVTLREGTGLSLWGITNVENVKCRFDLAAGVRLRSTQGAFNYVGTKNMNSVDAGTIFKMSGMLTNEINLGNQWQLRAYMTGSGGIQGGSGGYLQLLCPTNDFTGGLDITGAVTNKAQHPVGGVVAYANGAIPNKTDSAPLAIRDATLQLRDSVLYTLPDFVAEGRVVVSNMAMVQNCTVKSLHKTGTDELTIFGPFCVAGDAAFDAGTVCLATRVPTANAGLKWEYRNPFENVRSLTHMGVDVNGVSYAYQSWPRCIEGKDGATDVGAVEFRYTGYIRVPGNEGEDVRCNFMTCICRDAKVVIGDVTCSHVVDNKYYYKGENGEDITITDKNYKRLFMAPAVTLKGGWQKITVTMKNYWNASSRGPADKTDLGWTSNFAIGVDWQARCVTNVANYAKLLDPGDGSFLRPSLDGTRETDQNVANYRASFAGAVAFGPGVVFDVGDATPYWPLTIPSLTGLPTVQNGVLNVKSSTWTLRKSDLLDTDDKPHGKPLTLVGDAGLTFPAGQVTIDLSVDDAAALADITKSVTCDVIADASKFSDNRFVLSPTAKTSGFRLLADGGKLTLTNVKGLTVIIR